MNLRPNPDQRVPKLEYRRPSDLIASSNNARNHPDRQIRLLESAIGTFDFVVPVIIDEKGTIMAGHARTRAAVNLELERIPCLAVSHLTAAQRKAFALFDNRISEYGTWDKTALYREFAEILEIETDFDLSLTGFPTLEIDLEGGVAPAAGVPDPDDDLAPEDEAGAPVCREGDLWVAGVHRIVCASWCDAGRLEAALQGETAELVISNLPVFGSRNGTERLNRESSTALTKAPAPPSEPSTAADFLNRMAAASRAGSTHFLVAGWHRMPELFAAFEGSGFEITDVCVSVGAGQPAGGLYRADHTLVVVLKRDGAPEARKRRRRRPRSNVWRYSSGTVGKPGRGKAEKTAPRGRPVTLVADAIEDVSSEGALMLDPCLGSGATLLAAERTGRRLVGLDANASAIDLAIRRWQRLTGRTAQNVATGLSFVETERRRRDRVTAHSTEGGRHG